MSNWDYVALEDICAFVNGGTPSRKNPDYFKGTIPWITGSDITDNVITTAREYITEQAIQESSTHVVPKGNILLVTRTGVGKVAITGVNICISQDFTGLIPDKQKVSEWYLLYFFKSKAAHLVSQQRGATIQGITRETVESLQVPLPPLPEQRRIAALLDKADRLRRTRRYAAQLSGTFLQAVFVRMFGDPVRNPREWDYETVEELCDLVRGSSPRPQGDLRYFGGTVPRLMVADITRDGIYVTPRIDSLTEEGAKKSRPMNAGSVVMVVSGNVGLPAILNVDACIHDGFVGFRELNNNVVPVFFVYFLKALKYVNKAQAAGAIWQNLSTDQIKEWKVILPPLALQQKFARIVQQFEHLRAQQREAERQAEHLFQALLHRAFSGEG